MFATGASERKWTMFQDQFSSQRVPEMKHFVCHSSVGPLIAALMASKSATFFYDHVICKTPTNSKRGASIPWHQDLPYWNINGKMIGSVWVPLDKMSEDVGVSWILGSHKWGLFRPQHFVDASPYEGSEYLPLMPDIADLVVQGKVRQKQFAVNPGDVLCFDARIIHGSGGNTDPSRKIQRRVALRFGGDDAVYFERPGETAIPTSDIDHGLEHNSPLACKTFPTVWPREKLQDF
mmetsp:Transcript_42961/g.84212  ORF Transcript_42961/g.84212 Transcript_42961/m.84212 type:complete len:235 (+) Transcript_42961:307-1011(+)